MEAERVFRELGIPIIETSELTIEEIATKVLNVLGKG
jgi:regulator of PEP synthase PpsR (kinase-PPPase family)